jgi:hypothetical protein
MASPDLMAPPTIRSAAPKAKMTVYFALLIISLVALLLACLFMYLEIRNYGGYGTVKGKISAVGRPAHILLVGERNTKFFT